MSRTEGKPWIPSFSDSSWFRCGFGTFAFASSPFGKSSMTSTKCGFTAARNSSFEKTSSSSLWHQWHQSDPVKSTRRSLPSSFALATAVS